MQNQKLWFKDALSYVHNKLFDSQNFLNVLFQSIQFRTPWVLKIRTIGNSALVEITSSSPYHPPHHSQNLYGQASKLYTEVIHTVC